MTIAPPAPSIRPAIVDRSADRRFRALVTASGRDPDHRWIGGYVDYEWEHGRHVYEAREGSLAGKTVLEFGCNYGASCIVLATLGAHVTGIDMHAAIIRAAEQNVARYGLGDRVRLIASTTPTRLPFAAGSFDVVACNSVLEYVEAPDLPRVLAEIDRVLKPGGRVFVTGTSSRLALREVHSGRWIVNYLPERLDRWLGRTTPFQRGIAPWTIRYGFGSGYENLDWLDRGRAYLDARQRFPDGRVRALRAAHWLARRLGMTLGLLTPSISVTLRKPDAAPRRREP